jgi:hypothetical protein
MIEHKEGKAYPKILNAKEHGDFFFIIPFCGEAMHMRNMGMSFFGMPFT